MRVVCRTESIIRRIDRENRALRLHAIAKRARLATCRATREALRFLALLAGTSLFTFIAIPIMELRPERTLLLAEMLAVLAFALWLGAKIYEPGKKRK